MLYDFLLLFGLFTIIIQLNHFLETRKETSTMTKQLKTPDELTEKEKEEFLHLAWTPLCNYYLCADCPNPKKFPECPFYPRSLDVELRNAWYREATNSCPWKYVLYRGVKRTNLSFYSLSAAYHYCKNLKYAHIARLRLLKIPKDVNLTTLNKTYPKTEELIPVQLLRFRYEIPFGR